MEILRAYRMSCTSVQQSEFPPGSDLILIVEVGIYGAEANGAFHVKLSRQKEALLYLDQFAIDDGVHSFSIPIQAEKYLSPETMLKTHCLYGPGSLFVDMWSSWNPPAGSFSWHLDRFICIAGAGCASVGQRRALRCVCLMAKTNILWADDSVIPVSGRCISNLQGCQFSPTDDT